MKRTIVEFQRDEVGDWTAVLECGHTQHVRHHPPWEVREWVLTEDGRRSRLGVPLECLKCREPATESAREGPR